MKKITILFAVAMLVFACSSQEKAQITIHTAQIEAFHNLMQYVEEKAGGKLSCKGGDEIELQIAFDRNSKDSKLNALIDSLLNSSVVYLRGDMKNITVRGFSEKAPIGKEAYKMAFTILPDFCVDMSARMPEIWVQYWNHEQREHVRDAIIELKTNMDEVVESIKSNLTAFLPDDVDMNTEMNIHIIVDGYSGGFMYGNTIVMDLVWQVIDGEFVDASNFILTLTHEMHHIYYGKWFAERFANKERNEGEKYLYIYQRSFIFEGVAQQLFEIGLLVKPEVVQMYANRELIAELFDEWISLMRNMKGDSPQVAFSVFQNAWGDASIERLKRYWSGDPDSIEYAGRPTAIYYVSYNMYKSILEYGGHEKLKYVIENPDKLLSVFNELYTESMLIPRIPDDIVKIWQDNF